MLPCGAATLRRPKPRSGIAFYVESGPAFGRENMREPLMPAVKPVPEGYPSLTPYLIVGDGAAALEFYQKAFGARLRLKLDAPGGRIGHAELEIGDSVIMLADEHPEIGARGPRSFGGSPVGLHLYVEQVDGVVARAVAAGGKLVHPVEDKFYGDRVGTIEDPFGHRWYVTTHIEDVSPEEIGRRAAALHGQAP
jgi:PhnB protein